MLATTLKPNGFKTTGIAIINHHKNENLALTFNITEDTL
jgi:hypothetical protein